jgi:hypothetical protein
MRHTRRTDVERYVKKRRVNRKSRKHGRTKRRVTRKYLKGGVNWKKLLRRTSDISDLFRNIDYTKLAARGLKSAKGKILGKRGYIRMPLSILKSKITDFAKKFPEYMEYKDDTKVTMEYSTEDGTFKITDIPDDKTEISENDIIDLDDLYSTYPDASSFQGDAKSGYDSNNLPYRVYTTITDTEKFDLEHPVLDSKSGVTGLQRATPEMIRSYLDKKNEKSKQSYLDSKDSKIPPSIYL